LVSCDPFLGGDPPQAGEDVCERRLPSERPFESGDSEARPIENQTMRNDDPRKEALRRNREDAAAERARLIQTAGEEEVRRKIAALWPVGASGSIDGRPVTVVRL